MKIRALKTFYGAGAEIRRDSEADVSPYRGKQLIAKGYAVEVGPAVVPQVRGDTVNAPKDAVEAREDSAPFAEPFTEHRDGGRTGEEKPASSSRRGRPPKKQQSTSQEDDAE